MKAVEIALAGPPMAKQRVRITRSGHAYTPERTVNYEARLAYAAQEAMKGRPLLEGPLRVDVEVRMPIPKSKPKKFKAAALAGAVRPTKKPDADNFAKMLDALNLIVWADDAQIVDLRVSKFFSDAPAFIARVTPLIKEGAFG